MKIAIVSRGLVRDPHSVEIYSHYQPAIDWCLENLNILKSHLREHQVSTYFCSWNMPNARSISEHFDVSLLLKEPTKEESFKELPDQPIWFSNPSHYCYGTASLYKFFLQSRQIMTVVDHEKFDYVIAVRPDLRIRIDNINLWMNSDYNVSGMSYVNFNDHINIAPKDIMCKVWKTPNTVLHELVKRSLDTEDVVKNLVEYNGITHRSQANISEYFIRNFDVVSFYRTGGYDRMKKELGVS